MDPIFQIHNLILTWKPLASICFNPFPVSFSSFSPNTRVARRVFHFGPCPRGVASQQMKHEKKTGVIPVTSRDILTFHASISMVVLWIIPTHEAINHFVAA